jgi:hypothetical protein
MALGECGVGGEPAPLVPGIFRMSVTRAKPPRIHCAGFCQPAQCRAPAAAAGHWCTRARRCSPPTTLQHASRPFQSANRQLVKLVPAAVAAGQTQTRTQAQPPPHQQPKQHFRERRAALQDPAKLAGSLNGSVEVPVRLRWWLEQQAAAAARPIPGWLAACRVASFALARPCARVDCPARFVVPRSACTTDTSAFHAGPRRRDVPGRVHAPAPRAVQRARPRPHHRPGRLHLPAHRAAPVGETRAAGASLPPPCVCRCRRWIHPWSL